MSAQTQTPEEPSYLAFARANVRQGLTSSPAVVRPLVERIDREAAKPKALTVEQRDQLLDLHRAAMNAQGMLAAGDITPRQADAADDAFRDYLFSLDVTA